MFMTKKEAASSSINVASPPTTAGNEIFTPTSAFGRLRRLLSPKKKEKSSLLVIPVAPNSYVLERVFRCFDEDGDGKISPAELKSCIQTVGQELSLEDATAVVKENDSDGDGLLGMEDFVKMVEVEEEEEKRRNLREAFEMYEMEGSGCITPKSLKRMLGRLGETRTIEQCRAMITPFDLNGDGVLSFDEFRVMMV